MTRQAGRRDNAEGDESLSVALVHVTTDAILRGMQLPMRLRIGLVILVAALAPLLVAGHHPEEGGGSGSGIGGAVLLIGIGVLLAVAIGFFAQSAVRRRWRKMRKSRR